MGATIYNKAFAVELAHYYFSLQAASSLQRYFEIVPTDACAEKMRSSRMRFVRTGKGFSVFFQSYEDTSGATRVVKPLVELSGKQEFLFAVRVKESRDFIQNVTELNFGHAYRPGNLLTLDAEFTAYPGPPYEAEFSPSLIGQVRPEVFTCSFLPDVAGYNGNLKVTVTAKGSLTPLFTIDPVAPDPATGIYNVPLDFRGKAKGEYKIVAIPSGGGAQKHSSSVYVDPALAAESVFALLRITYNDVSLMYKSCADPEMFMTFVYAFPVRAVPWRYYVAVRTPNAPALTIADTEGNYAFLPTPNPDDFVINGYMSMQVFTSDTAIPFSETAIGTFVLMKGASTILPGLSNAANTGVDSNRVNSPDGPMPEIFVLLESIPNA
jgi:hypothetical protein